jgi:putative tryptophan/tyrosine transport system substrate-binding protein
MKRATRGQRALTAFLLLTFCTGTTWAQTKIERVGILATANNVRGQTDWLAAAGFFRILAEHGWVEGKNVIFEVRVPGVDPTRMAEPAADLVRLKVDVLFPIGPASVRAAFAATRDIPIVAHDLETDPVAAGYAETYSRPGRNLTGLFLDSPDLAGKWLELLKAMVPHLSRVVVLWDATSGPVPLAAVRNAAPALGIKLQVLEIHTPADIDKAPSAFGGRAQAIIALPSPMMYTQNEHLAKLATKRQLPGTSMFIPFADAGGLLAYGPNMVATFEQCALLLAKVLDGAKPGDLPIERPTKFEFVLNMKTARALRLKVPDTVQLRADRLIN